MKFICFVALTILFVAMIFCRKELNPDNPDSLFAKKEWANLQSVDVQGRSFLELEHEKSSVLTVPISYSVTKGSVKFS